MPTAIHISNTAIIGYDPSRAEREDGTAGDGWQFVTPEQFALAQSLLRPQWVNGEISEGPEQTLPASPSLIAELHAAFVATLTPEEQAAFAEPYAVVLTHIEAGNLRLAADYLRDVPVPANLAAPKAALVDLIVTASGS